MPPHIPTTVRFRPALYENRTWVYDPNVPYNSETCSDQGKCPWFLHVWHSSNYMIDHERRTITIDNYALSTYQSCPSKFDLRIRQGYSTAFQAAALNAGIVLHTGLETWYSTSNLDLSIEAMSNAWPDGHPIDDWRDESKARDTLRQYTNEYPSELWSVVGKDTSNPMVEVSFTLPTGRTTSDGYEIHYGGIFDLLIQFNGQLYVVDHKTTTALGDYYFDQYKPNNQMTGYTWAATQLSGQRIGGVMINAIAWSKTKPARFARQITTRTPAEISEWLDNLTDVCNQIAYSERTNTWPKATGSCLAYNSRCPYYRVHTLDNRTGLKVLESDYIIQHWNHESRGKDANATAE